MAMNIHIPGTGCGEKTGLRADSTARAQISTEIGHTSKNKIGILNL